MRARGQAQSSNGARVSLDSADGTYSTTRPRTCFIWEWLVTHAVSAIVAPEESALSTQLTMLMMIEPKKAFQKPST